MSDPARLILLTPPVADAAAFAPLLERACAGDAVAAVILTLRAGDERSLIQAVKALAPPAQATGAAVTLSVPGGDGLDLALIATRGGADGLHLDRVEAVASVRQRLGDRIVGAGSLKSRHDAMEAGEAGADYLLFGEPRADGSLPPLSAIAERAQWWAEIFQTPCAVYAPSLNDVAALAATGAEFVALGAAVFDDPDGIEAAIARAAGALQLEQA